jgi:gamma-glutamyltranspeptidase/glutathione hydrolase
MIVARLAALGLSLVAAWAAAAPPERAAVASAHPLASRAGAEILEHGGNAFDAAVAVSAALGVVEPYSSGLGGGAFFLLHRAEDGVEVMVDAREKAPAAASRDMYLDASGEPIRDLSLQGPMAAGIPGLPAGLAEVAERYGRLPLADSLAPAIRYADEGFPVDARLVARLEAKADAIRRWTPGTAFLPEGHPPAEGSVLRQPELARTLRALARDGRDGFYRGRVARLLVDGVRRAGGIWTAEDFRQYRAVQREPLSATYRGNRILTVAPPSSGGVALIDMLNMLSGYPLASFDEVTRKHLLIEVMRRAYRDRAEYLGDPDFVDMPLQRLLSPFYAAGQRTSLRLDRATPSSSLASIQPLESEGRNTSHFSILDREGNAVSVTQSINLSFGSLFMPSGTGVWLNDEMDDFSVKPGAPNVYSLIGTEANSIAPGKRMLSSMTPTMVMSDRRLAILGTPGGSRIITMVLLGTLAWVDGADAERMVSLPRFHHQYSPDRVFYEPGAFSAAEIAGLRGLGHSLQELPRRYGNMQVVTWDRASGRVDAASDPRGIGTPRFVGAAVAR